MRFIEEGSNKRRRADLSKYNRFGSKEAGEDRARRKREDERLALEEYGVPVSYNDVERWSRWDRAKDDSQSSMGTWQR